MISDLISSQISSDYRSLADNEQSNDQFLLKEIFPYLQQQDAECWNNLLNLYAPRLRRDIEQSLSKRDLPLDWVEDVEQETWLIAVQQITDFVWENEDKFYNWFRSIATYFIKNLQRKNRESHIYFDELNNQPDDCGSSVDFFMYIHGLVDDSPEVQFALKENLELVDHAMQMLKPREREILLKRLLYKEDIHELAIKYGVKPETISVVLVRAKHAIHTHLASLNAQCEC